MNKFDSVEAAKDALSNISKMAGESYRIVKRVIAITEEVVESV